MLMPQLTTIGESIARCARRRTNALVSAAPIEETLDWYTSLQSHLDIDVDIALTVNLTSLSGLKMYASPIGVH